ncbi:MAG TPA: TonB-dependent receptor [Terriglobales bacterium]
MVTEVACARMNGPQTLQSRGGKMVRGLFTSGVVVRKQDGGNMFRFLKYAFLVVALLALVSQIALAQRIDGTLRGVVEDPTGAVVADAKVTATNVATGVAQHSTTTNAGSYTFPNLLVGTYTVTVEKAGFKKYARTNVDIRSNQVVEVNPKLQIGAGETTVEVVAGSEVVRTSDSQLINTFDQVTSIPLPPSPAGVNGILNLAVLAPNTTTQGGGVLGQGGSIGGTRPRMNNFTVDGTDDNRVDITGPQSNVIGDSVADFTLLTNQFSAEYGHSAGGQFNVTTKSGTNTLHGTGFILNNNRNYNAFDNIEKQANGCDTNPSCEKSRFDFNTIGGTLGGPIKKDKIFFFGGYQRVFAGFPGSSVVLETPTAAGITALKSVAENSAVTAILDQFPAGSGLVRTTNVTNTRTGATVAVPVGNLAVNSPSFYNEWDWQANGDINWRAHSIRLRYLYNRQRTPNLPDPPLPQFFGDTTYDVRRGALTDAWVINDRWVNDFRAGYTRQINGFTVPPEFDNFPNVFVNELSNFQVGPEGNSPQGGGQNVYQLLEQMTYTKSRHTLKWGAEFRRWIAPSGFLPRARGEWQYSTMQELVNDFVPTLFAKRGAGSGKFDGNQTAFYGFFQDDWRVAPHLTLNLGMRYEWVGIPNGAKTQALNSLSNAPGTPFIFEIPKTDTNNWAPRFGFAWDPRGNGKWAVRGGFGVSYDLIAQNFPTLQLPPQLQSEQDPDITCGLPNRPAWCAGYNAAVYAAGGATGRGFLGNGGLLQVNLPCDNTVDCRAATQGVIPDQIMPKVYTWTASVQHELGRGTSIELRYLGTRGVELFTQTQLNAASAFDRGAKPLPTYIASGSVPGAVSVTPPAPGSTLPTFAAPTLADFNAIAAVRPYQSLGFLGSVTGFPSNADNIYHSGSVDFQHRMSHGVFLRANYTWAHNIDTATNELFSSLVNPRRGEDGNHIERERGRSVLDIRHKLAVTWIYNLPKISTDSGFLKALLHGWVWNGTYILQTGQPVNVRSAVDSNGNKDSAGDRAIFNPAGDPFVSSGVNVVCGNGTTGATFIASSVGGLSSTGVASGCAVGNVGFLTNGASGAPFALGYLAKNSAAGFIQAGAGALTNTGRNNITSPGRNNFDMSLFKDTKLTERVTIQVRAESNNVFNHRQFSFSNPGVFSIAGIDDSAINAEGFVDANGNPDFRNPKQLNGGSRTMQLGLKVIF